jgi:predicted RNA-binding protein
MCEAQIYLDNGQEETEIMKDVVRVEPDGDTWVCISMLGERKLVRGNIEKIDFLRHTVHLSQPSIPSSIEE